MNAEHELPSDLHPDELRALMEQLVGNGLEPVLPLSSGQQRLWFVDQVEPNSSRYNIPSVVWLDGNLNVTALECSLHTIAERHESLRSRFINQEGEPAQVISPVEDFKLWRHDLTGMPAAARDAAAKRFIEEEVRRPFDLSQGPPMRTILLGLSATEHVLIVNIHHIVSDEWSIRLFFRELQMLYNALVRGSTPVLPDLPIQYADYAAWQHEWMAGDEFQRQLQFWTEQLAGNPAAIQLPTDRPRHPAIHRKGALLAGHLSAQFKEALCQRASRQRITPFMLLLAAFKALLYRYTGQEDIIVGSPMACRNHTETENLIGFFANTLPLRTRFSSELSFEQAFARVRETVLGAYSNQEMPFEKLVEVLQPQRAAGETPFINVLFLFQNEIEFPQFIDLRSTLLDVGTSAAKFDLTFYIAETDEGLVPELEYNPDLFNPERIAQLLENYERLLAAIVADPAQPISKVPLELHGSRPSSPEWTPPPGALARWQFLDRWFELRKGRSDPDLERGATQGVLNATGC